MSVRFVNRAFVLVLLALQLPGRGQTASEQIASIVSSLRNREFDRALQMLQPALQQSPKNAQLWMLKGLAYAGKGDNKAALTSYQNALKVSPDYLPALKGAAQVQYDAGDSAAIPLLQHILRLQPKDSTSHAMLAVMLYKNGDCESAVDHFGESEALLDSQPAAMQDYGICLLKLKRTDKAIAVFRAILNSHPEDARAMRALSSVQLDSGKAQDALATLQPLLRADPDPRTMQLAAAICEANGDTPNAVKYLREAIVKDPHDVSLYVDFASLAMSHQSFQAGVEMMDAGINVQPEAAALFLARGVLYVQLANYEAAEADFEKAEELDPKESISAAAQGMIAEEQNQNEPDQALATVRLKLKKNPGDAFLWYLQAAILSQKAPDPGSPEFEEGLNSARKAVTLQPSLTAAHDVLAKFYLQSGQDALAIKQCRLALQNDENDQTALYHLVLALRKTKDQAEIPELLKRLAKARQETAKQEAERNRYKLVVSPRDSDKTE
ncbi:MAG TPA: tetratricopeptide repeat protein [Candidatus Sulfotelmatobacter sp.]|nr:tetratricopeptide repeat protein [Candidatus Sulfotelmatobacter sp.]